MREKSEEGVYEKKKKNMMVKVLYFSYNATKPLATPQVSMFCTKSRQREGRKEGENEREREMFFTANL